MSSLTIDVTVAGVSPSGLTVSAWPASIFKTIPGRGAGVPNTAATATGTTTTGAVTLTGLSVVDYEVLVIDARGVNNWWLVPASYIGGTFTCIIPWTTPTSVTKPISSGGDTPGGPIPGAPFAPYSHIHEVPASAAAAWPAKFNQPIPNSGPMGFVASPVADTWYQNNLTVPVFIILSFDPFDASALNYGGVTIYGSDDGGVTPVNLTSMFDTVAVIGEGNFIPISLICPAGSAWKWHNVYATGGGRTAMLLYQATYYY